MRHLMPIQPRRPRRRTPVAASTVVALALLAGVLGGPGVVGAEPGAASPGAVASPGVIASPAASPAPSPAATFDPAMAKALQKVVTASRARIPAPGLSVAVLLDDGRLWTGVAGDRQLSPPEPVDPDTEFAIASITKTFVTAVVMQLRDEGKLSLDDRLSRFLPGYPRADQIKIRQLLGHMSGIYDYFENPAYAKQVFANPSRRWTPKEILKFVRAPYCEPGRCFHYSNTNFVLLGLVIQKVTGQPLPTVIRERLLDPLGLTQTVFQDDEKTPRDAAHGHLWGGGDMFYDQTGTSRVLPHRSAATVAWAAGAMASTPTDLAHWADALYGGEVVSPESLAAMLRFREKDEYGLGTRTRVFAGHRAIGHLGGIRGYELAMWHFPEVGATIVALTNRGMFSTDKTVKLLTKALFSHLDPAPAGSPAPTPPAGAVPSASPPPA